MKQVNFGLAVELCRSILVGAGSDVCRDIQQLFGEIFRRIKIRLVHGCQVGGVLFLGEFGRDFVSNPFLNRLSPNINERTALELLEARRTL